MLAFFILIFTFLFLTVHSFFSVTSDKQSTVFLSFWIRIRIQQLKLMRIHADPDPQPWTAEYYSISGPHTFNVDS